MKKLLIFAFVFAVFVISICNVSATNWTTTSQTDFEAGTLVNLYSNSTGIIALFGTNTTGSYTSIINNTGSLRIWKNISWTQTGTINSNLTIQVRSCDDSACDGDVFIGPSNSTSAFFFTSQTGSLVLGSGDISSLPINQYVQFRANWSATAGYSSTLLDFTVGYDTDTTAPTITLIAPWTTVFTSKNVFFNMSANELVSIWIVNWNDTNFTITPNETQYVEDGNYLLSVYATDSSGNTAKNNTVWFTVDTTAPTITIHSPVNNTISTIDSNYVFFNMTSSEGVDRWIANWNGTNFTFTPNETQYVSDEGSYQLKIYANDSYGNTGLNNSVYFTIDIPATTGGGGGGGSVVSTDSGAGSYPASDAVLATPTGYSKPLATGGQVTFSVGGSSHSVKVNAITSTSATVVVSSTPQTVLLNIGNEKNIDVTGDGINDLYLKLLSITNNKANITIRKINGTTSSISGNPVGEFFKSPNGIFVLVIGGILIVGLIVFVARKK